MSNIRFDNTTKNFESNSAQTITTFSIVSTSIFINGNSKRLNIPQRLRKRYQEYDKVRFIFNYQTEELFIEFDPEQCFRGEFLEIIPRKYINTGRGYFVTLPAHWYREVKPKKAQLIQTEIRKSLYKVMLYD